MMRVAGAPVSFGVFELAPEEGAELPGPDRIASVLRDLGYTGIDLGPVGFLGRGDELRDRLGRHGLSLVGGWVDLPFSDDAAFAAALPSLDDALDVFVDALTIDPAHPPLPTLADSGSAARRAQPGGGDGLSLDGAGWATLVRNVEAAAARVRARGLEPTFHHHACTFVETPDEIETFLDRTDVGLTLDTGHLILGGGDPLAGLRRWGPRVNHVHLKDARAAVLRDIVEAGGGMREVWSGGAFVPLGDGDLDLPAFMAGLQDAGFDGWIVIEQDTIPRAGDSIDRVIADQRTNREALKAWLP
jgi:inosose dehydratase